MGCLNGRRLGFSHEILVWLFSFFRFFSLSIVDKTQIETMRKRTTERKEAWERKREETESNTHH